MKKKLSTSLLAFIAYFAFATNATSVLPQSEVAIRNPAGCKQCIIVCEQSQHRILIIEMPQKRVIWEWQAKNSNIDSRHTQWFDFPDEAKPVYNSNYILITASGGGVALIRLSDKKAVFYAYAGGNPHSAEILPDGNIVSASSTGNFLTLFKTDTLGPPENVISKSYPIIDGHNVEWDKKRQVLWAGSGTQLKAFTYHSDCRQPKLEIADSITLPDNLHDLFPAYNEDALWLSTDSNVFKLNLSTKQFEAVSLTIPEHIKSVSSGPAGFSVIVIHPKEKWWTDTILDSRGETVFTSKGLKIYKARWLLNNAFSYPENHAMELCF